jgi:hypothetical protein
MSYWKSFHNIIRNEFHERDIMNRELFLMVLILMMLGSEVAATPNHSLKWGVEIGDEFVYVLQKKVVSDMFGQYMQNSTLFLANIDEGQKVIARVDRLGEFPDEINSSRFLPDANCTLIRENDSEIIMENMSMIVVPIGDWKFLKEISNYSSGYKEPGEQEDNDDEWGTRFSGSFLFAIFAITMNMTTIYEKANGTLKELQFRINVSGDDMLHIVFVRWHPGMETILPAELQLLTLFLFISISGVIAIIILFFYKRRTGHLPFRGNEGGKRKGIL